MTAPEVLLLGRLDVYDVAFLAGGPPRVVDTAVVALVAGGRMRVGIGGRLQVADLHRSSPVEAAVLDGVGTRGRSVHGVRWRIADDGRIAALAARLQQEGLVRRAGRLRRRRSCRDWVRTRAGARVLRQVRSAPPGTRWNDGSGVLEVALGGPARMSDAALRARIFGVVAPRRTGIPFRGHVTDWATGVPLPASSASVPFAAHGGYDAGGDGGGC